MPVPIVTGGRDIHGGVYDQLFEGGGFGHRETDGLGGGFGGYVGDGDGMEQHLSFHTVWEAALCLL